MTLSCGAYKQNFVHKVAIIRNTTLSLYKNLVVAIHVVIVVSSLSMWEIDYTEGPLKSAATG